jgi:hypothetical protein
MPAAKVASRTDPEGRDGADVSSALQPNSGTEPACAPKDFTVTEGRRARKDGAEDN